FGTHALEQKSDRYGRPDDLGRDFKLLAAELIADGLDPVALSFDRRDTSSELELRSRFSSRFEQALRDLAVTAARIVEPAGPRRLKAGYLGSDLAQHLPERVAGDPFLSGGNRQFFGLDPPELPGVREVELAANRLAQAALQHGGKGFGSGIVSRQHLSRHVRKDTQGKP